MKYPNVNAHLHTPYSFSAFSSLTEALDKAAEENVKIVGINDFYSTEGYIEWRDEALKRHLYPLFNIEFISLQEEDQKADIRVNDPNNPGRTYISGKGLKCPPSLAEPHASLLAAVKRESDAQVREMCCKLNEILDRHEAGFRLDYYTIKHTLTKGSVRERHLAKALRMAAYKYLKDNHDEILSLLEKLFDGKTPKAKIVDHAAVENEIRSNLLKSGGAAFVPENSKAFLPLDSVRKIILAAGGIPTYPVLGDDAEGKFTDFEEDVVKTAETLRKRGIFSVEFITSRNSIKTLEKYAGYFSDNGFAVTFGSEHNTPAMEPVELFARKSVPLTDRLKRINYEGACIVAAHQVLVGKGERGFVD
ncbi:MAG: PHP domain-containing protein, partial [Dysgonamonadaceae bacterium]|nr:PHP domain-containing protein [Dysgonamonadaceae bacterium]